LGFVVWGFSVLGFGCADASDGKPGVHPAASVGVHLDAELFRLDNDPRVLAVLHVRLAADCAALGV